MNIFLISIFSLCFASQQVSLEQSIINGLINEGALEDVEDTIGDFLSEYHNLKKERKVYKLIPGIDIRNMAISDFEGTLENIDIKKVKKIVDTDRFYILSEQDRDFLDVYKDFYEFEHVDFDHNLSNRDGTQGNPVCVKYLRKPPQGSFLLYEQSNESERILCVDTDEVLYKEASDYEDPKIFHGPELTRRFHWENRRPLLEEGLRDVDSRFDPDYSFNVAGSSSDWDGSYF